MIKKITGAAALCLALNAPVKAQDLVCGAIGVNGQALNRTARIKIVNQGRKDAKPLRVYVELHTNNERDNPIAQLSFTEPVLPAGAFKVIDIRFSDFKSFRQGFSIVNAKKLVVICDPKNEVKETNETNNTTAKQLN